MLTFCFLKPHELFQGHCEAHLNPAFGSAFGHHKAFFKGTVALIR